MTIIPITNAEFIAAAFPTLIEGAFVAVSSKAGNPDIGGWPASRFDSAKIVEGAQ